MKFWIKRLGWMLAIWAASVMALGLVAGVMRALMRMAGMHTGV